MSASAGGTRLPRWATATAMARATSLCALVYGGERVKATTEQGGARIRPLSSRRPPPSRVVANRPSPFAPQPISLQRHLLRMTISPGDLVIVYSSRQQIDSITITPNLEFQSRYGHFKHDDMIGVPFGSKVVSPLANTTTDHRAHSRPAVRFFKRTRLRLPLKTNSRALVRPLPLHRLRTRQNNYELSPDE